MNPGGQNEDNPFLGTQWNTTNGSPQNRVLGGNMPTGTPQNMLGSQQMYGSNTYMNRTLQGHSEAGQNIIGQDRLNAMAEGTRQMTPEQVRNMQYQEAVQSGQAAQPTMEQPLAANSSAYNQLYMRPGSFKPLQNQGQSPIQPQPDLSTSDGSLAYLDSISPKNSTTTNGGPALPVNSKIFVIAGVVLVVITVLVAVGAALSGGGISVSSVATKMGTNLANLQKITQYGTTNAEYTSSSIRSVTAETEIIMLSHQKQLGGVIPLAVDDDGEVEEAKADKNITDDLEKAKANGTLDEVYRQKLEKELTAIQDETNDIYKASKDKKVRDAVKATYEDIDVLLKRAKNAKSDNGGESVDNPDTVIDSNTDPNNPAPTGDAGGDPNAGGASPQ